MNARQVETSTPSAKGEFRKKGHKKKCRSIAKFHVACLRKLVGSSHLRSCLMPEHRFKLVAFQCWLNLASDSTNLVVDGVVAQDYIFCRRDRVRYLV